MDYVDWVDKVLQTLAQAWKSLEEDPWAVPGVHFDHVTIAMGFPTDDATGRATTQVRAVVDALRDLDDLALVEKLKHPKYYKLTQNGRQFLQTGPSDMWESMVRSFLEPRQQGVLEKLLEMSQQEQEGYVTLRNCPILDLAYALGGEWYDPHATRIYHVLQELKESGCVRLAGAAGAFSAKPTYKGCVRVTRRVDSEGQTLIRNLLPEWESANVDFKREIDLATKPGRAEFVKDILALVNTKVTGGRYLIIGFSDDEPHEFVKSVDLANTKDRMEDILNAYCEPVPTLKYTPVRWDNGIAGIIEPIRQAEKLPYRVKENLAKKISAEDVFVRHGSHIHKAEGQELSDLVAEGERARHRVASE